MSTTEIHVGIYCDVCCQPMELYQEPETRVNEDLTLIARIHRCNDEVLKQLAVDNGGSLEERYRYLSELRVRAAGGIPR